MHQHLSVLDIGTWTVKALVVELQETGNAANGDAPSRVTILGRGRARHPGSLAGGGYGAPPRQPCSDSPAPVAVPVDDPSALAVSCEKALRSAEDATETTSGHQIVPDAAAIAVPTAWLCGATGSGGIARSALETGITPEECLEPLARAGRHALRNLGRVTGPGAWELLDATLVTFHVNGNPVTDPVGFRGHSLAATVFVVAAPGPYLDMLRQVADALQLNPPHLVAEPLALAAAVADDGLIVQAGAHTTGLTLSRRGAPLALGSIGHGGTGWTQALSDAFGLSLPRAEALKCAYSAGKLPARHVPAVQKALAAPLNAWVAALIARLRSQSWDDPLPPRIYLCGGASALPGAQEALARARWLDTLPFPHTPETRLWDGSRLSQAVLSQAKDRVLVDRTEPRWQLDGVTTLALAAWATRRRGIETPDGMLRATLGIE